MPTQPTKLKRVVIKEELVALTGHHIAAIVLNQFLYWSERTNDTDEYIIEEAQRAQKLCALPLTHGWVYKTAEEMGAEIMLGVSPTTIRKYIKQLVSNGWLAERNNPKHKWDRTLQYRPDILKIQADLEALGYALEGYPLLAKLKKLTNASQETENGSQETENRTNENLGAISETTTETTTKTTTEEQNSANAEFAAAPPPQPKTKNGRRRTAQDDMFDLVAYILYKATPETQAGMSQRARANTGRTAKRLLKMEATEEIVRAWFKWWKNVPTDWNWQGKKKKPLPSDLSDSWAAFLEYREEQRARAKIDAANRIDVPQDFMENIEHMIRKGALAQ
jgi:Fic family protein